MRRDEIKVGHTYCNRGAGRTERTVLAIGDDYRPLIWFGSGPAPEEPGVEFSQRTRNGDWVDRLYLSAFAAWCGMEVQICPKI